MPSVPSQNANCQFTVGDKINRGPTSLVLLSLQPPVPTVRCPYQSSSNNKSRVAPSPPIHFLLYGSLCPRIRLSPAADRARSLVYTRASSQPHGP